MKQIALKNTTLTENDFLNMIAMAKHHNIIVHNTFNFSNFSKFNYILYDNEEICLCRDSYIERYRCLVCKDIPEFFENILKNKNVNHSKDDLHNDLNEIFS